MGDVPGSEVFWNVVPVQLFVVVPCMCSRTIVLWGFVFIHLAEGGRGGFVSAEMGDRSMHYGSSCQILLVLC